jgi:hypothetical protein
MKRALGIALFCIIGLLVLWTWMFPTYAYRYRLTVALEINGEVHTGSSVIEVRWVGQPNVGQGSFFPYLRGQAAFIDLGSRQAVVAALGTGESCAVSCDGATDARYMVETAFHTNGMPRSELPRLSGRRDLAANDMPRLIWFADVDDPKEARKFKPEDIPTLFGAGARLVAAYVEITSDPIVIDIDKRLPWYKDLAEQQKLHGVLGAPGQFQLIYNMFIGEDS